jgi:predicted nuclease of restriction endonuclease-like (RecB) superfamily
MRTDFSQLITRISQTDDHFRKHTAKSIDKLLTIRNWLIGAYISIYEQNGADRAKYGSKLEENLARKINQKGLSARNLKLFKQFYSVYPQIMQTLSAQSQLPKETVQTVSALFQNSTNSELEDSSYYLKLLDNLSFSHFVELLKIEDGHKRQFYEIQVIQSTLSVRELKRQINTLTYERTGVAINKECVEDSIQDQKDKHSPMTILKTPYVFGFLGLSDTTLASESELEDALITHLKGFMLELGHGFCFESQQKRLVIGGEYYFIDLVFYNRILKCHVLIELKIDSFKHEHAGQLNTYLQYFKKHIQESGDNPPIGILLCTNKNSELVEYALGGMDENLFVSQYQTMLPSQADLEAFLKSERKKLE